MSTSTPTYASFEDFARRQGLNMSCEQIYGLLLIPYVWTIVSAILYVVLKAVIMTPITRAIGKALVSIDFGEVEVSEYDEWTEQNVPTKRRRTLAYFAEELAKSLKNCMKSCGWLSEQKRKKLGTAADAAFSNTEYTTGIYGDSLHSVVEEDSDVHFFARVSKTARRRFTSSEHGGIIVRIDEGDIEVADKAAGIPALDSCINTCTDILPEPCKAKSFWEMLWEFFIESGRAGAETVAQAGSSISMFFGIRPSEEDIERHKGEKVTEMQLKIAEEKYNKEMYAFKNLLDEVLRNMKDTGKWGRRMDVLNILLHRDSALNRRQDSRFPFGLFPSLDLLARFFVDVLPERKEEEKAFFQLLRDHCGAVLWNSEWEPKLLEFKKKYEELEEKWSNGEKSLGNSEDDLKLNLAELLPPKASDEARFNPMGYALRSGGFDKTTDTLMATMKSLEALDEFGGDYRRWRRNNLRAVAVDYEFDYRCAFIEEMKILAMKAMKQNVRDRWRRDTLIKYRYTDDSQFKGYWQCRFPSEEDLHGLDEKDKELMIPPTFKKESAEWPRNQQLMSSKKLEKHEEIEKKFLEMSFRDARKCLQTSIAALEKAEAIVKIKEVELFCTHVKDLFDPLVIGGIRQKLEIDKPNAGLRFWAMNAEQLTNVQEMLISISVFIICCTQIDRVDTSRNFGMSNQYQQFYGLLVNSGFVSTYISITIDFLNVKEQLALQERVFGRQMQERFFPEEDDEKYFKRKSAAYEDAIIAYDLAGAVNEGETIPGYGTSWGESPYFIFFWLVMAPVFCTHMLPMIILYPWVFVMLALVPVFTTNMSFLFMYFVNRLFESLKKCMRDKNWSMGEKCVNFSSKCVLNAWSSFYFQAFLPVMIQFTYTFLFQTTFTYGALLYNRFDATPGNSGIGPYDYMWVVWKDYSLRTQTPCYLERAWAANNPKGLISFFSFI